MTILVFFVLSLVENAEAVPPYFWVKVCLLYFGVCLIIYVIVLLAGVFFTVNLLERNNTLLVDHIELLRESVRKKIRCRALLFDIVKNPSGITHRPHKAGEVILQDRPSPKGYFEYTHKPY